MMKEERRAAARELLLPALMAGYFVANYTITNQADYQGYLALVGPILQTHGSESIIVDSGCEPLEGSAGQVTVVLRFATKAAGSAPVAVIAEGK